MFIYQRVFPFKSVREKYGLEIKRWRHVVPTVPRLTHQVLSHRSGTTRDRNYIVVRKRCQKHTYHIKKVGLGQVACIIYIYIHTWETIETRFSVRTGLDIFPSCTFFSQIRPCPAATPLLASRRTSSASIWGSMLTYGYCCFQHDVEKILVFFEYIQIWWEIWQYLLPDLGTLS
jgi:hypothetical protein